MASLNPVAVTSADLLRAIDQGGWVTRTELFESIGRDPKNCARDLGVVEKAGLIRIDPDKASPRPITLTEEGQAQLAAIGRAEHGGQARRPRDRCLVANIIANPANRRVEDAAVAALADTIEAVGDVLESVQLTPADANGVRMLLDGEHRWRAVQMLTEQGRLPEALEKGLRFEEREATEAEQILIRIVTATARADLSPLDDARQLLALQKATNWSAREIAKKTGRSPADSDTGVRDVQVKIRIAKEATPDALAAYEADGSWDRLRESVTEKKPAHAAEAGAATTKTAADFGVPADFRAHGPDISRQEGEAAAAEWIEPGSLEILAMADGGFGYPRAQVQVARIRGSDGWISQGGYSIQNIGHHAVLKGVFSGAAEAFGCRSDAIASAADLIRSSAGGHLRGGLPKDVESWLDQLPGQGAAKLSALDDPLVVNGIRYPNVTRANDARRAAGILPNPSNSGSGKRKEADASPADAVRVEPHNRLASDLAERADRMGAAAITGREFVLAAAVTELTQAIDSHLAGIRRELVRGGQDLAQFEEDTETLREAAASAADAIEGLGLGEGEGLPPIEDRPKPRVLSEPFVPIRKSITPEHVTCLYDGRRFAGGLRRHLLSRYNETPDEYRRKWNLPADYPMVAPNHAKRQHEALRAAALRSVGR